MNVGVYIGAAPPEVGGGFTFAQDVLQEIGGQGAGGPHRFTIVTESAAEATDAKLDVLSLAPVMRELPARVQLRLSRSVDRLLGHAPASSDWSRPSVDRLL